MADWSQLPNDLLHHVLDLLGTSFDSLRLRSVCSSWRSSILPNQGPAEISEIQVKASMLGLRLTRRTIYRVSLPPKEGMEEPSDRDEQCCNWWMLKTEEDNLGRIHLLNLFSGLDFLVPSVSSRESSSYSSLWNQFSGVSLEPSPSALLKRIDLLKFRVCELGQEYVLYNFTASEKQAAIRLDSINDFTLLSSDPYRGLRFMSADDQEWKVISGSECLTPFDSIKFHNGDFYAAYGYGAAVVFDSSLQVGRHIPHPDDTDLWWDRRYLVESRDELLLVHASLDVGHQHDEDQRLLGYDSDNESVLIMVYKLSENRWVLMESLGDQILFLGRGCAFSASASDLPGLEGNVVIVGLNSTSWHGVGVYHLDTDIFNSVNAQSKYSKIFWPPPCWVTSVMMMDEWYKLLASVCREETDESPGPGAKKTIRNYERIRKALKKQICCDGKQFADCFLDNSPNAT